MPHAPLPIARRLALACVMAMLVLVGTAAGRERPAGARPLARLPGPTGTDVAFSGDGKRLLTAGGNEARVWDAETFTPLTEPLKHGDALARAALSPDGRLVVTAAGDDARLWDADAGKPRHTLQHGAEVRAAAFSPDGSRLLTAGGPTIRLWDCQTGRQVRASEHDSFPYSVEFAAGGRQVLAVVFDAPAEHAAPGPEVGQVHFWDIDTGRARGGYFINIWPMTFSTKSRRPLRHAAMSPDGTRLVMRVTQGVGVWDTRTGRQLAEEHTHCNETYAHKPPLPTQEEPTWLTFAPDGSRFLSVSSRYALLWEVDTARPTILRHEPLGHWRTAQFIPDGRRLLLTGVRSGAAVVLDVPGGAQRLVVPSRPLLNGRLRFPLATISPDGRRVAMAYPDEQETTVWAVPPEAKPDTPPGAATPATP